MWGTTLLFLIYINDLHVVCKNTFPILFADDTNLFTTGTDLDVMQSTLNEELNEISTWLKVNKLSLNVNKFTMWFSPVRKFVKKSITLKINGQDISEVVKTKFLDVNIDNKVNWKDHINYIAGKISRGIGMVIKARNISKTGIDNPLLFFYISLSYLL